MSSERTGKTTKKQTFAKGNIGKTGIRKSSLLLQVAAKTPSRQIQAVKPVSF
jgi:hypothetical protein